MMAHNIDFTKTLLYQEGRKAGLVAAKLEEKLERMSVCAKRVIERNYTTLQIQDITDLSFEQIQKLQDEINNQKSK